MADDHTPQKVKRCNCTLRILELLRADIRPSQIWKDHGISKRNVLLILSKLQSAGLVRKVGFGTWEVLEEGSVKKNRCEIVHHVGRKHTPPKGAKPDDIRRHGVVSTVKVPRFPNWTKETRRSILEKRKIPFKPIPQGERIRVGKVGKVWLTNKSIVFYFKDWSWYAPGGTIEDVAAGTLKTTIEYVLRVERMLGISSMKIEGAYWIKFSRQHDALIKNTLASMYNNPREKISFRDEKGQWALIDNSFQLEEFETTRGEKHFYPYKNDRPLENQVKEDDDSKLHNRRVKRFMNSVKKHDVDVDFILERFKETSEQIMMSHGQIESYAKALAKHERAWENLGDRLEETTKAEAKHEIVWGNLGDRLEETTKAETTLREEMGKLVGVIERLRTAPVTTHERAEGPPPEEVKPELPGRVTRRVKKICALCGQDAMIPIRRLRCDDCEEDLDKSSFRKGRYTSLNEYMGGES